MDHSYYKERISAFADGALPPYEQRAVEEHLATCAECRVLLDQIRKLTRLAEERSGLGESDYWESQAQKIEARLGIGQTEITQIKPVRTWRGLGWKLAAAAASIAVVGIIGYYSKDVIWEKTDRPVPMMQAPRMETQPKAKSVQVQPAETTVNAPAVKPMPAGRLKSAPPKDTDNYKRPNQVRELYIDKSQSEQTDQSLGTVAIPEEMGKSDSVRRVDNLLKSVAGVKTIGDSGLYIRGGRAGEVEYIVDSVAQGTAAPAREKGRSVTVAADKNVISKFEVNSLLSKSNEQIKSPPVVKVDSLLRSVARVRTSAADSTAEAKQGEEGLAYWRAVRDSLGELSLYKYGPKTAKMPTARDDSQMNTAKGQAEELRRLLAIKPSSLAAKDSNQQYSSLDSAQRATIAKQDSLLLRAYYQIARLSADSTEVESSRAMLQIGAQGLDEGPRRFAKVLLDSLGIK